MTLRDGKRGNCYIVERTELPQATRIRLEALGLTEGTKIQVLNTKRTGSIIINVRGTRLAFGRQIAEAIFVEYIQTE